MPLDGSNPRAHSVWRPYCQMKTAPPPLAVAPSSADPLRLQAILAALQAVQLQRSSAGLHASPGPL